MQNVKFRSGPLLLTTIVTNILNPGITTGGTNSTTSPWSNTNILVNQITIVDRGGSGGTFTLYLGASGGSLAGTELAKTDLVPVNGLTTLNYPGGLRLSTADFITGSANVNNALDIIINGEVGIGT